LLAWLKEAAPDIVCVQELKAPDEKFPEAAIRAAGYGAVWQGQKSWNGVAILARGAQPEEARRSLPGDPDDTHSRYIEAVIDGMTIGCLYLPNGNPAPGPKFDYKLRWFDRLAEHARSLLASGEPVVLAGDYNVMPTDLDVYAPERWVDDALFRPEVREAYRQLVEQGWTDALRALHPGERIYTSGSISGTPSRATPVSASIICYSARRWQSGSSPPAWTERYAAASMRAIMRPPGSNLPSQRRQKRDGAGVRTGQLDSQMQALMGSGALSNLATNRTKRV
jgi:exodeoxyribonuclease-3